MNVKKILAVDDSKSSRSAIIDILSPEGYEVIEATDGKEAITKMLGIKVDLIYTDLYMPNMDGIELLKRLRRSTIYKNLPIVIVSVESNKSKVVEAAAFGVSGWLVKPFSSEQIIECTKRHLNE